MTEDQAHDIIRKLAAAGNREELQTLIGKYISVCDDVFFRVLSDTARQMRERGDEANAHKLQEMGNVMARLRFLI